MNNFVKNLISKLTKKIRNISLPKIVQRHPIAFSTALMLHFVLFIALLFTDVQSVDKLKQQQAKKITPKFIPKAITIDLGEIKKEKQRLKRMQKQKDLKFRKEKKRLKKLTDERWKEQIRLKKARKAKKLAEEKAKVARKKAKTEEEKRKKLEQQSKVATKQFKEAQKQRELMQKQQQQKDQNRKVEQQRILDELKVNYIKQIAARVRSKWRYEGAKDDWTCRVYILQDQYGSVQTVKIKFCDVDNKSREKYFKNSIERAVNKASPLPIAPDKSIFDKEIEFDFRINK